MLVAGGAANSMIIFHAESVKVPVNCTLTSASELEAALPKELLPISALGKRIHHCRPQETAKSFPELPAAKSPCLLAFFFFFPFFSPPLSFFSISFFPPSEGEVRADAGLFLLSVGLAEMSWWLCWRVAQRCPGLSVPVWAAQRCSPLTPSFGCAQGPWLRDLGSDRGPAASGPLVGPSPLSPTALPSSPLGSPCSG